MINREKLEGIMNYFTKLEIFLVDSVTTITEQKRAWYSW